MSSAPRTEPPARRYLALWFPFLSTERHAPRRPASAAPDEPLVLVEKDKGGLRLAALDPLALRLGLALGMTLADARAGVPALRVDAMDRQADDACLRAVASACERFTPLLALDGADGLMLDITGCAHLFGGERAMMVRARRLAACFGLSVEMAIAGTPDAAHAFARYARDSITAPGEEAQLARRLPVTALEAGTPTAMALVRAGLKTLGDLAARPPGLITARFGAAVTATLRRILGQEDIRLVPLRPPPACIAEQRFPEPLGLVDSLLAVLEKLTAEIMAMLERRGEGGRLFEISFFRADGATRRIAIETARGTRDGAALLRLARLRIETLADPLDPGFGFDALRLAVIRSEALHDNQPSLAGPDATAAAEEARAVADLVDRLVARFGRDQVRRFVAGDAHDPLRAGGSVAYLASAQGSAWPVPEPAGLPARPLTLFDPPQPISATAPVPDGPPHQFTWRRVTHKVVRAEGPERLAPEWWRRAPDAPTQDYYRLEDENGHRFWVFREGLYPEGARPDGLTLDLASAAAASAGLGSAGLGSAGLGSAGLGSAGLGSAGLASASVPSASLASAEFSGAVSSEKLSREEARRAAAEALHEAIAAKEPSNAPRPWFLHGLFA